MATTSDPTVTGGSQGRCPVDFAHDYNPFVEPQLDDPYPVWELAREEQPVFYSEVIRAWVITKYDDVVSVLREPTLFTGVASRKVFGEACPEADRILAALPSLEQVTSTAAVPPVHTKLRRYLQPAFGPKRVAGLDPEFRRISSGIIDGFEARGHGNFYEDYAFRYPFLAICHLIGLPEEHHAQIKAWAGSLDDLRYGNLSADQQIAAAQAQQQFFEFNLEMVQRRRAEPGDDLLSWIIEDSDGSDDPLSEEQLAYQIHTMLSAGHKTSAYFLMLMMHRLLQDRPRWSSLVADPSLGASMVEEFLRMDGPVTALHRFAQADTEVGGVKIPAGAMLSIVLSSANADPGAFDAPREYRAERDNVMQHVTFGRGIHTCVGAPMVRLEIAVALETLAQRLPKLRLAADPGVDYKPSAQQREMRRLNVEWT